MSTVFGSIRSDGGSGADRLRAMMAPLCQRAVDGESSWGEGGVAVGIGHLSTLSALDGPGLASFPDCAVAIDGRIDNLAELRAALGADQASTMELLGRGYVAWGEGLFKRLVGEYALAIWDRVRRVFLAGRDALGTRPLYYWETPTEVAVASDVEAFLGLPGFDRVPDDHQVVDYLVGNYRDATRTFFRAARCVPNGHYLAVFGARTRVSRYWFPPADEARFRDLPECHGQFREVFRRAVSRRLTASSPVLAHLSGGLDSTAIICTADQLQRENAERYPPIRGVSALHSALPCDESRYVSLVAACVNIPVETWDGTDSDSIDLTDPAPAAPGARAIMSGGSLGDLQIARRIGARVILSGTGGDQIGTPSGVLRTMFARGAWRDALRWSVGYPRLPLRRRLRRLGYGMWGLAPSWMRRAQARRRRATPGWLAPAIQQSAGEAGLVEYGLPFSSETQMRHWQEMNSPRMAASLDYIQRQASEHGVEVRFPFLDLDLVTWVLRLPFDYWPPPEGSHRLHRDALIRDIPEAVSQRRDKAEFSSAYALRVRKASSTIGRFFEDGVWASEPYVQRSKARAIFDAVTSRRNDSSPDGPAIWRIATLEAWLRAVFGYPTRRGR